MSDTVPAEATSSETVGLLADGAETSGRAEPPPPSVLKRALQYPNPQLFVIFLVCIFIVVSQCLTSFELQNYAYYRVTITVSIFDQEEPVTIKQVSRQLTQVPQLNGVGALTEESYSSSYPSTYKYNVWTGVWELLTENAIALALLVTLWSGLWPYAKLIILGRGLVVHKDEKLPASYEWLSSLAHWSFVDAWMVAITGICIRFYYEDSDTKSEYDGVEIKVKITLELWAQAIAMAGAYCFLSAIVLSQTVGFVMIYRAQSSAIVPKAKPSSAADHVTKLLLHPRCLGWDAIVGVARRFKVDLEDPAAQRWHAKAVAFASGALLYGVVFFVLLYSFHVNLFSVIWDFALKIHVDEDDDFSFDKTYNFDEDTSKSYSVYSGLSELLELTDGVGSGNFGLCYLGRLLVIVFPLIRVVMLFVIWTLPMPKALHHLVQIVLKFLSIFVNHDVFALAYVIMIPMGQLKNLVEDEISGYSEYDDDEVTESFSFSTYTKTFGCVFFLFAVSLENFAWIATTHLHDHLLENEWNDDREGSGFEQLEAEEPAEDNSDVVGAAAAAEN